MMSFRRFREWLVLLEWLMSKLRSAKVVTRRAPIGGWNARDPLEAMPETDATALVNWIPEPGGLRQRTGYDDHNTGATAIVGTLMTYSPPTGSQVLFAAIGDDIYNVTAAGARGASVYGSGALNTPYWSHTMLTSAANSYLFLVNGSDDAVHWNGTTWTVPAITGVASGTLATVTNHKNRLWFTHNSSLQAWYLPNNSVAGAATSFDLGPLAKMGGRLVGIGTWTRDGGLGPDDYIVFLTSKGEAIVYSGTDPSSASTWGLVGTYQIPPPVSLDNDLAIGQRCIQRVGGDLLILTVRGIVPLSTAMGLPLTGQSNAALTAKIAPEFESSAANAVTQSSEHWQLIEYPKERLLICNIPRAQNQTAYQYVLHAETMGWCKFENIDALCWGILGNDLYFGNALGDIKKVTGTTDQPALTDTPIESKVIMSFHPVSQSASKKRVTMTRATMVAPSTYLPKVVVKFDYNGTFAAGDDVTHSGGGTTAINSKWQASQGFGNVMAPSLWVKSDVQMTLHTIDVMYEEGGPL